MHPRSKLPPAVLPPDQSRIRPGANRPIIGRPAFTRDLLFGQTCLKLLIEGFNLREIATIQNVSIPTVRKVLHTQYPEQFVRLTNLNPPRGRPKAKEQGRVEVPKLVRVERDRKQIVLPAQGSGLTIYKVTYTPERFIPFTTRTEWNVPSSVYRFHTERNGYDANDFFLAEQLMLIRTQTNPSDFLPLEDALEIVLKTEQENDPYAEL